MPTPKSRASFSAARIAGVGADLRQVAAEIGTGVQVDQDGTAADHAVEDHARHDRGDAAVEVAGERAVEVAPIRHVAVLGPEARGIDRRQHHQRAGELLRVDAGERAARDLHAVDLVAVDRRGHAQGRAAAHAARHEDREVDERAFEGAGSLEAEAARLARRDALVADRDRAPFLGLHRQDRGRGEQHVQEPTHVHGDLMTGTAGNAACRNSTPRARAGLASVVQTIAPERARPAPAPQARFGRLPGPSRAERAPTKPAL